MLSDAEIIEAVLRGDVERYAELVNRYQQAAWKVAYSFVGNFEDAKDISQNGFVKAYQHLGQFRGRSQFSTWFYRIIVNECKDFFKRKSRQPKSVAPVASSDSENDPVVFEVEDPRGDPRDVSANHELAKRLAHAIEGLGMKQRTAFVLHHLDGMSLEEVARVMGCRVGTVKAHISRAAEHLRRTLGPYVKMEMI